MAKIFTVNTIKFFVKVGSFYMSTVFYKDDMIKCSE